MRFIFYRTQVENNAKFAKQGQINFSRRCIHTNSCFLLDQGSRSAFGTLSYSWLTYQGHI